MRKLVGQISVESSGEVINVSFYNAPQGLEVVSTEFNVNTNEIVVTLNQNILDSGITIKKTLGTDNNRVLYVSALNQTQINILVTDFDGVSQSNFNTTYFEIDYIDEVEYNAFELSKLAHAQSILFGSGSEKLIALAEKIGAPRPRP
jgi:hypothetical protein